jgi:hypothetical protein
MATQEAIRGELAEAVTAAQRAQEAYQTAALDNVEKRVSDKALDKAAEVLREADRRVRGLKAAQVAAEARDVRRAEEALAAKEAAEREAIQVHLRTIHKAALAFDDAVDALAVVTSEYDHAVRAIDAAHPPQGTLNKLAETRINALYTISYRLKAFLAVPHLPPFWPASLARLVDHLPPFDEAQVTQPAE